jgi:hypothetical protein
MLPYSSSTPTAALVFNSKAVTVVTLAKRSSQNAEIKDSDKESESDAEEVYLSENLQ